MLVRVQKLPKKALIPFPQEVEIELRSIYVVFPRSIYFYRYRFYVLSFDNRFFCRLFSGFPFGLFFL